MNSIAKAATGLAVVGFLCAVLASYLPGNAIMGIWPETFSNAATNLALIALCLFIGFKEEAA